MAGIQKNSLLGDATGTTSTQGATTTFPAADPTQPDPIYGWSDYIRQQKESCNAKQGCEWDSTNETCNCLGDKDSTIPGPCDTASCPEGYTCKENPDNPAGYDCISDAVYAETLDGYLDTVNLGGFCQGATEEITERGQAGCESAKGTWVDYESFFGPNYYKKIAETFGFGTDDYSEFFPEFPFEAFEDVLPKLPEYAGQQQALINRAFGIATADRKRRQATIDQAYKDGLISIDQHEELLKSAFALQAVTYQQQIGTEKYKARINQAYDEGHISKEEKDQLLSALGTYEGTFKSDMDRKLAVALEEKTQSLGNVQRQFQTSVSELRGSLLGALPGISEALGTEFAGSGYAKTMEQRVYEQSQDAFSNIVANIYIPDFENIQSKYNLTTGQIKEETQEAMDYAYLKFLGDEQSADASEQAIIERSNSIRLRKQEADAGLLTDAEKDQLARDEASLNLRDEMDKRISEVDSILYDWLNQTIKQAGIVAEGIDEDKACPEGQKECSDSSCVDEDEDCPPETDVVVEGRSTESCDNQCQFVSREGEDYRPFWEKMNYTSIQDCVKGCSGGDDGFATYYSCNDANECVADAAGEYTTSDCDGACAPTRDAFSCQNGACTPDPEGNFETEQACIDSGCTAQPHDCEEVNGVDTCVPHLTADGLEEYANLTDCEAGCGDDGCESDTDCDDGYKCVDGKCVEKTGCDSDADCTGDNEECVGGKCVEKTDGDGDGDPSCPDCGPKPNIQKIIDEVGASAGATELYESRLRDWNKCCDAAEKLDPANCPDCGPKPTVEGVCGEAVHAGCEQEYERRLSKWSECCGGGEPEANCDEWCAKRSAAMLSALPGPYRKWKASAPAGCTEADCTGSARYGANFITSGPRNLLVGDNPGGRELVQVTPIGSQNVRGPSLLDQINDTGLSYSFGGSSLLKDLYK